MNTDNNISKNNELQDDLKTPEITTGEKKSVKRWNSGGGMYRGVSVPIKILNAVIVLGVMALIVLVVVFTANGGFTVEFNTDGGTQISAQRLKYGENLLTPEIPIKAGYEFDGWFTDGDLTREWSFESDTVKASGQLYAKWTPVSMEISFTADGVETPLPNSTVTYGESYGKLPVVEREGYTFDGWYYNGKKIDQNSTVSMNGPHNLVANWIEMQ